MVKSGESLELDVAQKYVEYAEEVWQSKQAELANAKQQLTKAIRAEKYAKAKRDQALAFLTKAERRLEVIDIDDQEGAVKNNGSVVTPTTTCTRTPQEEEEAQIAEDQEVAVNNNVVTPIRASPNAAARRTSEEEVEQIIEIEGDLNLRANKRQRQGINKDDESYNSESDEDYTPPSRPGRRRLFQQSPSPRNDMRPNGPSGINNTSVSTNPSSSSNNDNSYDWIPKFHDFLINVPHGRNSKTISAANARSVVRQVEKLAKGLGITYQHWPYGTRFAQGETIDYRTTDLNALHRRAKQWEQRYGRDKGNGWLLQHPIKKLQIYQEYLKSNNSEG